MAVCWQPYYSKGCAPGNVCPLVGHYYPSVSQLCPIAQRKHGSLGNVDKLLSVCRQLDISNLSGILNCSKYVTSPVAVVQGVFLQTLPKKVTEFWHPSSLLLQPGSVNL